MELRDSLLEESFLLDGKPACCLEYCLSEQGSCFELRREILIFKQMKEIETYRTAPRQLRTVDMTAKTAKAATGRLF